MDINWMAQAHIMETRKMDPIDNNSAVVQIMAWRWIGDKPLDEAMLT